MHTTRIGMLVGPMVFGGVALTVPVTPRDWALAGSILSAALVQAEVTRRTHPGREEPRTATAMASVWSMAAAVSVHLTLGIAVVLGLHAYRYVRDRRLAADAGVVACALVAAHFAASSGAWATPGPQVLAVCAAVVAHLTVNYVFTAARRRRTSVDLGLEAALLTVGGITGALATGGLLVVLVAIPVVVTLHNAALTKQLEDDASLDKKTGLSTPAAWQAHAERVFAAALPNRRPIGVLMVDLDHFKRLNDTYGHKAGDDVLAAVGACLRSELRQTDLGGRFGGEEFTILLPDTDIIDTMTTAERIRAAIAELRVSTVDNHGEHTVITGVTASIGAAAHPHHGTTVEDCLRVADNHVYQAKEQGRNMVIGIDTDRVTMHARRGAKPPQPR